MLLKTCNLSFSDVSRIMCSLFQSSSVFHKTVSTPWVKWGPSKLNHDIVTQHMKTSLQHLLSPPFEVEIDMCRPGPILEDMKQVEKYMDDKI
jgi:hypothetical protein